MFYLHVFLDTSPEALISPLKISPLNPVPPHSPVPQSNDNNGENNDNNNDDSKNNYINDNVGKEKIEYNNMNLFDHSIILCNDKKIEKKVKINTKIKKLKNIEKSEKSKTIDDLLNFDFHKHRSKTSEISNIAEKLDKRIMSGNISLTEIEVYEKNKGAFYFPLLLSSPIKNEKGN
jgi:formate dehydrogenase maturation protein FdhE